MVFAMIHTMCFCYNNYCTFIQFFSQTTATSGSPGLMSETKLSTTTNVNAATSAPAPSTSEDV